jgi:hypothetical protein
MHRDLWIISSPNSVQALVPGGSPRGWEPSIAPENRVLPHGNM